MSDTPFHPENSRVAADKLADFVRDQLDPEITSIPGIGPAAASIFADAGITTSYQLVGKFLSMKDSDIGPIEHVERFYQWLCALKISGGHRAGTVHALAEKLNIWFPGLYDADSY